MFKQRSLQQTFWVIVGQKEIYLPMKVLQNSKELSFHKSDQLQNKKGKNLSGCQNWYIGKKKRKFQNQNNEIV